MSTQLFVTALYQFHPIANPVELRDKILELGQLSDLRGTMILAEEGINGTIAGARGTIDAALSILGDGITLSPPRLDPVSYWPFKRLFVHIKSEIVTMGVCNIDPNTERGLYIEPSEWNALVDDPEIVVVDTRNDFEFRLGTFAHSENPETTAFTDFPSWADEHAERLRAAKGVAMFCTGGIRCEKATSYLKRLGIKECFHLKGGILRYLDEVPESENRFLGDCFVFDQRIALGPRLTVNPSVSMCFGCRHPLTAEMRSDERYEEGVSCADCFELTTSAQKLKFRTRHQQLRAQRTTEVPDE